MKELNKIITVEKFIFYLFFSVCFLFGGFIQFLGIISNTFTTIILVGIFLFFLITKTFLTFKIKWNIIFLPLIILTIDIIMLGVYKKKGSSQILLYLLYVFVPFCSFYIVKEYVNPENIKKIIKLMIIISIIQLPVIILQYVLYPQLIKITSVVVSSIDIGFGTFFLKADAEMCTLLLLLIIFLLFDERSRFIKNRKYLIAWLCLTILMSNSKISVVLLFLIVFFRLIWKYSNYRFLIPVLFLVLSLVGVKYWDSVLANIVGEISRVEVWEDSDQVPRYAPLLIFASNPIKVWGDGPFTFYDPITKIWAYGGGHSQWYFIYNDLGIFGIILCLLILYAISRHGARNGSNYCFIYFFIIIIMSLFTTSMSQVGMMLTFSIFISTYNISQKYYINSKKNICNN